VGVDDVVDEEEYNKAEDMTPFAVDVDTSILLAKKELPTYAMIIMKGQL
jgi:hypothetical protein